MANIYNEKNAIEGNIFKYEERLQSHLNKYIENGATLTTWYHLNTMNTTVDAGMRNTEESYGKKSSLRYDRILDFPVYNLNHGTVDNNDENDLIDINSDGELTILPSTIMPSVGDLFIINHLTMSAIYRITEVTRDTMRIEGFYKCKFTLYNTDPSIISTIDDQVVALYHTELDSIGSNVNPIISDADFKKKIDINLMINEIINLYRTKFYNDKHNCFLYSKNGIRYFDPAANEFISRHSLMNEKSASKVISLSDKLYDDNDAAYYNDSIYHWIELGCDKSRLTRFHYDLHDCNKYPHSSFMLWHNIDINIVRPSIRNTGDRSYLSSDQFNSLDSDITPNNAFEKVIYEYMNNIDNVSLDMIDRGIIDMVSMANPPIDIFFMTPIIIFILRKILRLN